MKFYCEYKILNLSSAKRQFVETFRHWITIYFAVFKPQACDFSATTHGWKRQGFYNESHHMQLWTFQLMPSQHKYQLKTCCNTYHFSHAGHSRWYMHFYLSHCHDVTMGAMASQITSLTIIYSTVYSGADQRKHQISTSLAFVRGIRRWSVNSPHKWPLTWKMFPSDGIKMFIPYQQAGV